MSGHARGVIEIKIRLYPGQDDELIQWQAQLCNQPYGVKTQAVKEALRRGIGPGSLQAVETAPALDLAEIRRIVEAVMASALSSLQEPPRRSAAATTSTEEDDEVEHLLYAFQDSLVLGGDD